MPESKGRSKPAYTPPRSAQKDQRPTRAGSCPSCSVSWCVGLLWVVTYYISGANQYPIPALGRWNLGVGFGLMLSGFLMTTRWR